MNYKIIKKQDIREGEFYFVIEHKGVFLYSEINFEKAKEFIEKHKRKSNDEVVYESD